MPVYASQDIVDSSGCRRPQPAPARMMHSKQGSTGHGFAQSHPKNLSAPSASSTYYDPHSSGLNKPGAQSGAKARYPLHNTAHHTSTLASSREINDQTRGSVKAKSAKKGAEDEVDALTNLLMQNMDAASDPDFFGKLPFYAMIPIT